MKKASSFIVLLVLGSLMSDASAQRQQGQGQGQGQHQGQGQGQGQQQPGQGQIPGSSFPPYTQPGSQNPGQSQSQIISERVQQTMRGFDRLRIADLLRLSSSEARDLEIVSLTILAQSVRGQVTLDILESNRSVALPQQVRKQLTEVRVQLPALSQIDQLEIASSDDVLIDTITAEVRMKYPQGGGQGQGGQWPGQDRQPMPGQLVQIQINRDIRISGELPLKQLAKQQLGLSLEGAQIERIAVEATVTRGVSASVQLEMNNRIVASKAISASQRATPLLMNSLEEVRGNLRLIVRGDVIIHAVSIRVGQVRPQQPQLPQLQRVLVSQEISSGRALEIGRLLPYETRLISAISLEARTGRSQAEVALVALGQVVASAIVTQVPMKPMLQLLRPMSAQELRLQSLSPVMIDAIEVEFDRRQNW